MSSPAPMYTSLKFTLSTGRRISQPYVAIVALFLILGSCASFGRMAVLVPPEQLPAYTLEVIPLDKPSYTENGYELLLDFRLSCARRFPYPHLVQEITQKTTYTTRDGRRSSITVTLVEAFRLSGTPERIGGLRVYSLEPFQRDRHFETGFAAAGVEIKRVAVQRDARVYAAVIEGADFTRLGFAHLPTNRKGSVKTDIPENFNRKHQDRFDTTGEIVMDDREAGSRYYRLSYNWVRGVSGDIQATLDFVKRPSERRDPAPLATRVHGGGESGD